MNLRKIHLVVTGIEPTTSGLLDQRRSRSDNQAPLVRLDYAYCFLMHCYNYRLVLFTGLSLHLAGQLNALNSTEKVDLTSLWLLERTLLFQYYCYNFEHSRKRWNVIITIKISISKIYMHKCPGSYCNLIYRTPVKNKKSTRYFMYSYTSFGELYYVNRNMEGVGRLSKWISNLEIENHDNLILKIRK